MTVSMYKKYTPNAKKKHTHEVAGSKSSVITGYSNFPELPQAAQILWESLVQITGEIKTIADSVESALPVV